MRKSNAQNAPSTDTIIAIQVEQETCPTYLRKWLNLSSAKIKKLRNFIQKDGKAPDLWSIMFVP